MQKTFFGCAAVLPALVAATTHTHDVDFTPNMAAQIFGDFDMAEPLSFGQIEAEDVEFWSNYLTLVQNSIANEAEEEPYWTDGYTSLSQAEVENLQSHDGAVKQWGKGLAQTNAQGENWFTDGVATLQKFGTVAIDKAMAAVTPTQAQVDSFLAANKKVKKMAADLHVLMDPIGKKAVKVANIAGNFM
jgi:hypothetical protein